MKPIIKSALAVAVGVALLASAGCVRRVPRAVSEKSTGATETVAMGTAQTADLTVEMFAGELRMQSTSDTSNAVSGRFVSPVDCRPRVESRANGAARVVRIYEPRDTRPDFGDCDNTWDISLPRQIPTSMKVHLGAGTGTLDLRGVELTELGLQQGAGDVTVDLSDQKGDLEVRATLGAGEITIRVPAKTRVAVSGYRDGLGDWSAPGFHDDGELLVNDAYRDSPSGGTITLDVQRGLGQVNLVQVD